MTRMVRTLLSVAPVIVAFLLPISTSAHDTWLIPDHFEVSPKETVTIDLTSGTAFPALETGPKPERVEAARCRLAGRTFDLSDIAAGPKSLVFTSPLPEPGVATLWVKLPPKFIELKSPEVEEYLAEIAASDEVRSQWKTAEPKRWREWYTKNPKTFVAVGDTKADCSWAAPVGLGLEILPEKDPMALRAGDEIAVKVLKGGAPHPNFPLNAVAADDTKGETRKTDADGRVTFPLHKAGRWLLRGTDLRKSTRSDADWESDFTTLTIEVKAK